MIQTHSDLASSYVNVLNSLEKFARNHSGYTKLKITDDYLSALEQLKNFSDSLHNAEDAIRYKGLFSLEDQQKHIKQVGNIKEMFQLMRREIENQAKSKGVEIYFY